jgi:hypothetical protein
MTGAPVNQTLLDNYINYNDNPIARLIDRG